MSAKKSAPETTSKKIKAAPKPKLHKPTPDAAASDALGPEGDKPATETAAAAEEPKAKKTSRDKPEKLSALDAAAKVLAESQEPLSTKQMIEAMASNGYWNSPAGKTPHATLYSAILRELAAKGNESRFVKTERGKFTIKR